ncbi:DUF499 domain-containing protein [Leptospira fletcheri]|uniref:DUF499 domain-containing protein n=1 Tax=Leptospira fletcheri TaxID=2484981 RepID=A0A4R9G5U2_9LEPT|nr:DUF499 domain-containing protein [Leptospira fletcheri]TGK06545.1 DUF499 domain-containing protein [Leptospira fletcheri]
MKTIQELCKIKKNIITDTNRSYALNLTDLVNGKIDPEEFFSENYITQGMETLIRIAFDRFERKSETAVVKLTQAMGGGKTHNMVVVGLLAKYPKCREVLSPKLTIKNKQPVRVLSFSGRESDIPYGIWGELARQLGKLEEFKDYYNPIFKAPGETAWIRLLQSDEPIVILLDELPPYLENAASQKVGNSDLGVVTTTALSNLFIAVTKKELSNVLIIISDLTATYQGGSGRISDALRNLENETNRTSIPLSPVKLNSDEIYSILRKKLFDQVPNQDEIQEITQVFGKEVQKAKAMELTITSPVEFEKHIKETYPFHPSVKDIYARFRDNPGFQQTRGLIRLIRAQVAFVFSEHYTGENIYLLGPQHFDFNDQATYNVISEINPTLVNAISHDIASGGNAIAETLDKDRKDSNEIHQSAVKVIYFSSLAMVPNGIKGLSESELVMALVAPGRLISDLNQNILPSIRSNCWYLHNDREGKYVFRETQNIVAKINTLTQSYDAGTTGREIQNQLKEIFEPEKKDIYQKVSIFDGYLNLHISHDTVTLIINRPNEVVPSNEEQTNFYENQTFKNRVLFLTGERSGMEALNRSARNIKAATQVIKELQSEKIPESDLQFVEAKKLLDTYRNNFYSATRETFTRLAYPTKDRLYETDISMIFEANLFKAEEQIRKTLIEKQKFIEQPGTESITFKNKCEARLFGGSQEIEWSEIKKRAAMLSEWQWHYANALDVLKDKMLRQGIWRENGKFINKGPFPPPETSVTWSEIQRDDFTGEVTLRLQPLNGDKIYYDYHGDPTTASHQIANINEFRTAELSVRFLCIDSSGKSPAGSVVIWRNKIKLKYDLRNQNGTTIVELKSIPNLPIRYTTDGSDPRELGGEYVEPFPVTKKSRILAWAEKDGVESDKLLSFDVEPGEDARAYIRPKDPLTWTKGHSLNSTEQVFTFLSDLKKAEATASKIRLYVHERKSQERFADLSLGEEITLKAEALEGIVEDYIRLIHLENSQVVLSVGNLNFNSGESFEFFVKDLHLDYSADEIKQ